MVTLQRAKSAISASKCRTVMVCAPKGGVGKTTLVRSLLVNAAIAGRSAIGIDFDEQESLLTWASDRETLRQSYPEVRKVTVVAETLDRWRAIEAVTAPYDYAFIDTPPGVGRNMVAIKALCEQAAFTVIPTGPTSDDLRKIMPWGRSMHDMGVKFAFLLSRVNERTLSYRRAVMELNKIGTVLPVAIPMLESIPLGAERGMTVLDVESEKGADAFDAAWTSIVRECAP